MKKIKNEVHGITLISLMITIVILLILAGIGIYSGRDIIKKAKLEEVRTNMLLIQAKAKEYVEEATFKMGINPDEEKKMAVREVVYVSEEGAQLEKAETVPTEFAIADTTTCYWLTQQAQEKWGLSKMKMETDEKYLIQFNEAEGTVEVYSTEGYEGMHKLSELDQLQE